MKTSDGFYRVEPLCYTEGEVRTLLHRQRRSLRTWTSVLGIAAIAFAAAYLPWIPLFALATVGVAGIVFVFHK